MHFPRVALAIALCCALCMACSAATKDEKIKIKAVELTKEEIDQSIADLPKVLEYFTSGDNEVVTTPTMAYGKLAAQGQFPYVASVLGQATGGYYHKCTGSLIAKNMILTAAHCLFDGSNQWDPPKYILLGGINISRRSNFAEMIATNGYYYPNNYNPAGKIISQLGNDLAIVRLVSNSNQTIVNLSTTSPNVGTSLTSIGWGMNENFGITKQAPVDLGYAESTVSVTSPCPRMPPGVICGVGARTASGGYPSTCQGDSGGPQVLTSDTLVQESLTSFGPGTEDECGTNPWVAYTSVAYFQSSFIQPTLSQYGGGGGGSSPPPSVPTVSPAAPIMVPITPNLSPGGFVPILQSPSPNSDYEYDYGDCTDYVMKSIFVTRLQGGTAISSIRARNLAACQQACLDDDACFSANYRMRAKSTNCYLFQEQFDELSSLRDANYVAIYKECSEN